MPNQNPTSAIKGLFEASSTVQKPVYSGVYLHKLCVAFNMTPRDLFNRVSEIATGDLAELRNTHAFRVLENIVSLEPEVADEVPQNHTTQRFGFVNGRDGNPHKIRHAEIFQFPHTLPERTEGVA